MRRLLLLLLIPALLLGFTSTAGATITGHCKDADHVGVGYPPTQTLMQPSDVTFTTTTAVAGDCVNDLTYAGTIYQITIPSGPHSTKTLNLKPDGATGVCNDFIFGRAYYGDVNLLHKSGGVFIVFGSFSDAAEATVIYTYHVYGLC